MKSAKMYKRLIAFIIDVIVVSLFQKILIYYGFDPMDILLFPIGDGMNLYLSLLNFILLIIYFTLTDYFFRGSPGKRLLGIEVVNEYGHRISLRYALFRNLIKMLSIMIVFVGYIPCIYSDDRRAVHDLMAGALVVERPLQISDNVYRLL